MLSRFQIFAIFALVLLEISASTSSAATFFNCSRVLTAISKAVRKTTRQSLITETKGYPVELEFIDATGTSQEWSGFSQSEVESRIAFPPFATAPLEDRVHEDYVYSQHFRLAMPGEEQKIPYGNMEDLALWILTESRFSNPSDGVYFSPLAVSQGWFHGTSAYSEKKSGGLSEEPFAKILDTWKGLRRSRRHKDAKRVQVKVGIQDEASVYFDTPDRLLETQNLTLRLKQWYPIDASSDSAPVARTLCLKSINSTDRYFSDRNETMFPVPKTASEADIQAAALSLVKEKYGNRHDVSHLVPQARIFNRRIGFNLNVRTGFGSRQIGFAVLDGFESHEGLGSLAALGRNPQPESAQMEIEIFPDKRSQKLFKSHKIEVDRFIGDLILSIADANVTHRPKVRLAKELLESGSAPLSETEHSTFYFGWQHDERVLRPYFGSFQFDSSGRNVESGARIYPPEELALQAYYKSAKYDRRFVNDVLGIEYWNVPGNIQLLGDGSLFFRRNSNSKWIQVAQLVSDRKVFAHETTVREYRIIRPDMVTILMRPDGKSGRISVNWPEDSGS